MLLKFKIYSSISPNLICRSLMVHIYPIYSRYVSFQCWYNKSPPNKLLLNTTLILQFYTPEGQRESCWVKTNVFAGLPSSLKALEPGPFPYPYPSLPKAAWFFTGGLAVLKPNSTASLWPLFCSHFSSLFFLSLPLLRILEIALGTPR